MQIPAYAIPVPACSIIDSCDNEDHSKHSKHSSHSSHSNQRSKHQAAALSAGPCATRYLIHALAILQKDDVASRWDDGTMQPLAVQ
jgi:hypothetical protein